MIRVFITCVIILFASTASVFAKDLPFTKQAITSFNEPWAMTFMPDGKLLVTEKGGDLFVVTQDGEKSQPVIGVPEVDYRGQGGLGDVVLHPDFSNNNTVYLSYAEAGENGTRGAAVTRAKLSIDDSGLARLEDAKVIWRQIPKVSGSGHYGHRILFDKNGYMFISSGERQKFDPSQDMQSNMGKIVRLNDDGSIPKDNPFYDQGGVTAEIWSLGHRNPLGMAFDLEGRLWNTEMGPLHGDELNLVKKAANFGYPIVSNGDHYSGKKIPDHDTRPEFAKPAAWWKPTIAPSEIIFYNADLFKAWKGSAFIAGLKPKAIIRIETDGESAKEVERFDMGRRIREVEQGPGGAIWVLEDGGKAKLLKLTPG